MKTLFTLKGADKTVAVGRFFRSALIKRNKKVVGASPVFGF